jgi:dihydrodipicolinate reductase
MLNILVTGFRGRMGQAVATAIGEDGEARVAAGIDLGDSLEEALKQSEIVIDFTLRGLRRLRHAARDGHDGP